MTSSRRKQYRLVHFTVHLLLVILLVGCIDGPAANPPPMILEASAISYELRFSEYDISGASQNNRIIDTESLKLHLGPIDELSATYPDGSIRSAWRRSLAFDVLGDVKPAGASSSFRLGYVDCGRDVGRTCATELFMEPRSHAPFRATWYAREPSSASGWNASKDLTIPTLFWGWNDTTYADILPIFLGSFLSPGDWGRNVRIDWGGTPISANSRAQESSWEIEANWRREAHDYEESTRTNVLRWYLQMTGKATLLPDKASLLFTYEKPGGREANIYRIEYQKLEAGAAPSTTFRAGLHPQAWKAPTGLDACGNDLERPLLPGSADEYDRAFALIQSNPGFRAARERGRALLTGIAYERQPGPPPPSPPSTLEEWKFAIAEVEEVAEYTITRTSTAGILGEIVAPGEMQYRERRSLRSDPRWDIFQGDSCDGLDGVAPILAMLLRRVGYDTFYNAIIREETSTEYEINPADVPVEPDTYTLMVRPVFLVSGETIAGPRIELSLVTGQLVALHAG